MGNLLAFCQRCGERVTVWVLPNGNVMHVASLADGSREDHSWSLSEQEKESLDREEEGLKSK